MVNVVYLVISLISFVPLKYADCQSYVGDFCTLRSTGASGQCQLLEKCQPAIQALQSGGGYPQTCGFQGPQPIVCCAGSAPVVTPPPPTIVTKPITKPPTRPITTPTRPTTLGVLPVGEKSRKKCREYSKYVDETGAVFVSGSGPISSEDCAIEAVVNIVGGEITKPKEFPHMALIGFDDGSGKKLWQCGGSLISERFILTAAHCLFDKQHGDPRYIRLGELILNDESDDAEPQEYDIAEWFRHPDYKPPSQYNDIALLKMSKDANLNPYVRPACLNANSVLTFGHALASGWGKVGYTSGTSDHMLKVTLEYFTNAECNNSYKNNIGKRLTNGIVDESQVCAGSHTEKKDTCQGDSGGPLQIVNTQENCMYTIVGVTSFGKACGIANIPGVYTKVSRYIEWIEKTVWP